ncbi:MAG TPA: hypothetical protein VFL82_10410 [Thermomicrobiales bacterium]|jgi:hypothetical protein|nr:hypothetical protein [Thermomicrobiales bacterium]
MAWIYDAETLGRTLEAMGFDLDNEGDALSPSASLTGRQEWAGRATAVTVDAGGRVRVTMSVVTNDQRRQPIHAGNTDFQVTSETVRTSVAGGVLTDAREFREAIAGVITGLVDLEHEEAHINRWSPPPRRE